jgi:hypothetical protein
LTRMGDSKMTVRVRKQGIFMGVDKSCNGMPLPESLLSQLTV